MELSSIESKLNTVTWKNTVVGLPLKTNQNNKNEGKLSQTLWYEDRKDLSI